MLRSIVLSSALLFLLLHTSCAADSKCGEDSLPCDNGECVLRESWCDGTETCEDGSDEAYCKKKWWGISQNQCDKKIHFECEDSFCWPLAARCDGIADCKDRSDEDGCDSKAESPDELDEKIEDSDETKGIFKETDNKSNEAKSKESSEEKEESKENSEEKEESKESSEEKEESKESSEEKEEPKESSEENGTDKLTTIKPSTTTSDYDDYDEYEDSSKIPFQTTTVKYIQPQLPAIRKTFSTEGPPPEVSTEGFFWKPTTEMDFYAKKMEQSEVKRQHITQTNAQPTSTYRPPPVRSIAQYPTRPYQSQYTTSRRPAVLYTSPRRPYTPRPYRYIGAQYSGQTPSPYNERHHVHQPSQGGYHGQPQGGYRGHPQSGYRGQPQGGYRSQSPLGGYGLHYSPDNNYISSQYGNNHRQQYRNYNGNNGRADGRNGVIQPPRVYGRQLRAPSRFYFKKNYNENYGRANSPSIRRGVGWILSIRNATGGWDKETPRALVALSLVNNSFLTGNYENDLMQKYFQVHLAVNLLRDESVSLNRLAMFVNALIATCQDPRDFQGWDLTELIRNTMLKMHRASRPPVINPLVYLSLCLADRNLTHYEVHHLMTYLATTRNDEATRDMTCLALEAFACYMQKEQHNAAQYHSLQRMVWNATLKILERKKDDGSFGSVYSTALAVQALMSVNETLEWNPEKTFHFLRSHQQRNGSFGDFLATYQVLPALSGRSLLHLRNTECNPPRIDRELSPQEILQHQGPKSYIRYSLHMGSPLSTGYTVQVLVPTGISFFDVMRVAAYENDHFKFSYEEVKGKINVYSISDIPNDPEEGLAWRLYVRSPSDSGNIPNVQQLYTGDIRELLPTPDQHIIFWYHPLGF